MATDALYITWFEAVEEGYLLAFAASDGRIGATVRWAMRALNPWQRRWIADEQAWWVSEDAISLLARRLPAVHAALEQWRAQPDDLSDWIASGTWSPPRRRRMRCVPPTVATAYRQLGLAPGADAEQVAAARRGLARRYHPDTGGQHAAMVAINTASDTVTGWLSRRG
ncbi:MAG TPA: hypothetical protein VGN32_12150 [Ktedonobacterales bacterium]|jgi:hypothetical protein|nr:hypothetical protein [Ktedonobacterales bacterium]